MSDNALGRYGRSMALGWALDGNWHEQWAFRGKFPKEPKLAWMSSFLLLFFSSFVRDSEMVCDRVYLGSASRYGIQ